MHEEFWQGLLPAAPFPNFGEDASFLNDASDRRGRGKGRPEGNNLLYLDPNCLRKELQSQERSQWAVVALSDSVVSIAWVSPRSLPRGRHQWNMCIGPRSFFPSGSFHLTGQRSPNQFQTHQGALKLGLQPHPGARGPTVLPVTASCLGNRFDLIQSV